MKKTGTAHFYLLITLFLLTGFSAFSQTPEQKAVLQSLSAKWEEQFTARKERAVRKADSLGLPVRQEIGYGIIEIQDFIDGIPIYYTTHNFEGAQVIKSSEVWSGGGAGLDLSGAGQTLGMWDGGATRLTHQEF